MTQSPAYALAEPAPGVGSANAYSGDCVIGQRGDIDIVITS